MSIKTILSFVVVVVLLTGCDKDDRNYFNEESKLSTTDVTAPMLTLLGKNPLSQNIGDSFTDPGAKAIDDIDGDLTPLIYIDSNVNTKTAGNYKITYEVNDKAGNKTTIQRDVIIISPLPDVYISEFLASNANYKLDRDYYKYSDWIELKNNTNKNINISGYGLSDNNSTNSWKIPSGTIIPANGYKTFWADKEDNRSHTNFSIGKKDGVIVLYDRNKNKIDEIKYNKQKRDISYGRDKKSYIIGYMEPSFNKINEPSFILSTRADTPQYSLKSGLYVNAQTITISTNDNSTIYYTTDGTYPTKNSIKYTQAVNITKTTTLRAISYKNGVLKSKDNTITYFINHQSSLPIVSLSLDPKDLFDDMIGIYVDGKNGIPLKQCKSNRVENKNYAREWERPVHLAYFDERNDEKFSLDLDISIAGQCSRENRKKSFSFELHSKYSTKSLKYKLFSNKNITKHKEFKLKTGNYGFHITDTLAAALAKDGEFNVDYQDYKTTQLFVNGEYWGIYDIREKKGKDYLKANYPQINKNNLDIISTEVKEGNYIEYNKLKAFIANNDLSLDINYREITNLIDEDNFIDYMIFMIYSANTDWIGNNFRVWREKKSGAKWRWMIDDVDEGFNYRNIDRNEFNIATTPGYNMTNLFIALLKNSAFKNKFKKRFYNYLDTVFAPENVLSIIDKIVSQRENYMTLESRKWGITLHDFEYHIDIRTKPFAQKRRDIVKNQLDNF